MVCKETTEMMVKEDILADVLVPRCLEYFDAVSVTDAITSRCLEHFNRSSSQKIRETVETLVTQKVESKIESTITDKMPIFEERVKEAMNVTTPSALGLKFTEFCQSPLLLRKIREAVDSGIAKICDDPLFLGKLSKAVTAAVAAADIRPVSPPPPQQVPDYTRIAPILNTINSSLQNLDTRLNALVGEMVSLKTGQPESSPIFQNAMHAALELVVEACRAHQG